jgi:hypothetical protein
MNIHTIDQDHQGVKRTVETVYFLEVRNRRSDEQTISYSEAMTMHW